MAFLTRWKNRLTGGWADVDVEVSPAPAQLGADVRVTMTVVVKNVPIDVDGIIIEIRGGRERTVITADPDSGTYEKFDVLYSDQVKTAGAQQLAAASTHTFTATLPLPADAPHSKTRVEWQVQAILVMACVGHNPSSGWSHFSVRA
jgi:hypothetical protein